MLDNGAIVSTDCKAQLVDYKLPFRELLGLLGEPARVVDLTKQFFMFKEPENHSGKGEKKVNYKEKSCVSNALFMCHFLTTEESEAFRNSFGSNEFLGNHSFLPVF